MTTIDLTRNPVTRRPEFDPLSGVSLWFGVVAVLASAVIQISHPEYSAILILIKLMLSALTAVSILYFVARAGVDLAAALVPLLINLGLVLLVIFMPFDNVWETSRFRLYAGPYQYAAQLAINGQLTAEPSGEFLLPVGYRYLSDGGRVALQQRGEATYIFFYTRRDAGGNHVGYMYRSDGSFPETVLFSTGAHWQRIERRAPGWFYCDTN